MEVELPSIFKASWFLMLVIISLHPVYGLDTSLYITRHNTGDIFAQNQQDGKPCTEETCVGISSGTASAISSQEFCTCRCHQHLPTFREDLRICVDDIHECVLAPFVGGSTSQQIPFVFLPLKGQIIHPSKEINFAGIRTPVCAVSGAKFLTESGWVDLRNPIDTDVPFRLFRDEGRTFLQWVGEPELRTRMSGRLVMVYLMCRELSTDDDKLTSTVPALFSPCVAFRIVGTPTKYPTNVSEVAFLPDAHSSLNNSNSDHLSVSEYVAIGICSILLGLIYVASVFFYLHLKKRNSSSNEKKSTVNNKSLTAAEEGIIKNNPLLSISAHFPPPDNLYSDTNSSDTDAAPDIIQQHDNRKRNMQITSALIHSQQKSKYDNYSLSLIEHSLQDSASIERLPEENVSIIETLEGREDRPDSLKIISSGTVRKKLYFNPAYFEPHLLMSPPPAALEFLAKIREVIAIAKQKMASKRFIPSLNEIPEEDNQYTLDPLYDFTKPASRRSSIISLKRENSRRKTCTGCPGCEPQDLTSLYGKLPEFPSLAACQNCSTTTSTSESKQRSIRKWLENVPFSDSANNQNHLQIKQDLNRAPKRIRSPTKSLPPSSISERTSSPKPLSESAGSIRQSRNKRALKSAPPPIPIQKPEKVENIESYYDTVPLEGKRGMSFPPPDMIHEAMAVDHKTEEPTIAKKRMEAVINEFTCQKNILISTNKQDYPKQSIIEYETDSLERSDHHKGGYHTPSDYAEVSSSQPSPSLSAALPMEEEMTMRNAIFNKKTGNMTISKINMDMLQEDEHDYELIVLKKGSLVDSHLYKLPELLQRNNGYSLVSEVYVNNGYNYGSTPSTPTDSNCSTLEKRALKVRYEECDNKPGKLLIEVEDCPDNYIPIDDSDSFEPDTLDRKPSKMKYSQKRDDERPNQILLRTTGSFRSDSSITTSVDEVSSGNFNRMFGSLREIYEAKTKATKQKFDEISLSSDYCNEEGRLLTLEERHSKRQRGKANVQPDVIPPPPHDNSPIYEHPKPPRKIITTEDNKILKPPPVPPKNSNGRSVSPHVKVIKRNDCSTSGTPDLSDDYQFCVLQKSRKNGNITNLIQTEDIILKKSGNEHFVLHSTVTPATYRLPLSSLQPMINPKEGAMKNFKRTWQCNGRPEDSGYLSTDSNDDHRLKQQQQQLPNLGGGGGSETDESLCDGHSESGGESIETHSVFFGSFSRNSNYARYGSMDSGVIGEDDGQSTDSETVSYTTVVPITIKDDIKSLPN